MPLFRCSCILGGRCNRIKADEEIPEISGNKSGVRPDGTEKGNDFFGESEMEQALFNLHGTCIGSLSRGMIVHGPGILIHQDLILTSHGNLPDLDAAKDAEFLISYLPSLGRRRSMPAKTCRLEPNRLFLTDEALDLTLVGCEAMPESFAEIISTSTYQHLGSMDLLEPGHQVYVLGHLQSNVRSGTLTSGRGFTTVLPWSSTTNDTFVAFATDARKDGRGFWMPGTAGFDERGELSFMVVKPPWAYSLKSTCATHMPDSSLKRRSKEWTSTGDEAQYGVPLNVILDWMSLNGIKDLGNSPLPIPSARSISNNFRPEMGPGSIYESYLIPHNDVPLADRNSLSYVVVNAGELVLERKSNRSLSPVESFSSHEPSHKGNETPLQGLDSCLPLNAVPMPNEATGPVVDEKSSELPLSTGSCDGNDAIFGETMVEQPVEGVCAQNLKQSMSDSISSRPLKWYSRTSVVQPLKVGSITGDQESYDNTKQSTQFPMIAPSQGKEHNVNELEAVLRPRSILEEPVLDEKYFDLNAGGSADDKSIVTRDVNDQIYVEIPLDMPKLIPASEFTGANCTDRQFVTTDSPSVTCVINNSRNDREWRATTELAECDMSNPNQQVGSTSEGMGTTGNKVGSLANENEKDNITDRGDFGGRRGNRMDSNILQAYSTCKIGKDLSIATTKEQLVASHEPDFSIVNEEIKTNQMAKCEQSNPNMGLLVFSETSDAYVAFNSSMVGENPDESIAEAVIDCDGDDRKKKLSCSSASSSHMNSPLSPEEVSRRIQGYGNVSTTIQSANARQASSKEMNEGISISSSCDEGPPPLKALFGIALVSRRWMKPKNVTKAPLQGESTDV